MCMKKKMFGKVLSFAAACALCVMMFNAAGGAVRAEAPESVDVNVDGANVLSDKTGDDELLFTASDSVNYEMGTTVSGTAANSSSDPDTFYIFELSSSGKLKVTWNIPEKTYGNNYLHLYNFNDIEKYSSISYYDCSKLLGDDKVDEVYVKSGKYCVAVYSWNNYSYNLKLEFESANDSFTDSFDGENNDLIDSSNEIEFDVTYNGAITYVYGAKNSYWNSSISRTVNYDYDYYKFTIAESGRVDLTMNHEGDRLIPTLYDRRTTEIDYPESKAKTNIGHNITYSWDLKAGTYYVMISSLEYEKYSLYDFTLTFTSANESAEIKETFDVGNDDITGVDAVSLDKTYNAQIAFTEDYDYYRFNLTTSAKLNINLTSTLKTAYVYVLSLSYDPYYNSYSIGDTLWSKRSGNFTASCDDVFGAGIYCLKICKESDATGTYSFKLTATPTAMPVDNNSGANDSVNNDTNKDANNDSSSQGYADDNDNNDDLSVDTSVSRVGELKLTKGKKRFKATWKKLDNVNGYQIQYSLKKNMKKAKIKNVSASKSKVTIKKLKKKKTYYVRVRAYKNIKGNKYFGAWSKKVKVKTK